jgi:murein DD-endopeptidase MepM/ murein hydrolase activator NlpD
LKKHPKRNMSRFWLKTVVFFLLFLLLIPAGVGKAQDDSTPGPVYIVQEGDSLWDIAYRFHVSQDDLAAANGITNPNQITVGQPLVIPGLTGIQGILTTEKVSLGETLHSLGLRYQLSIEMLERLNHLTSPNEIFAGYWLVILQNDRPPATGKRVSLAEGQSLLELAVLNDSDPWEIMAANQIASSVSALPGEVYRLWDGNDPGPGGLPPTISSAEISGLVQGQTGEIRITGSAGLSLQGNLMDHPLNFFAEQPDQYYALQGVHAMAQPGLYPLRLQITQADQSSTSFTQDVLINAGDFLYDQPLSVDPATLDPEITGPEDKQWMQLASQASADKLWESTFSLPVEPVFAECYSSIFGSRRSYNGSDYSYFHTGLDYCGQIGDSIYAAAPGVVVFAGPQTVRGNATMIDHGWGVYTAYMHQSEILVSVGEYVEQGQLIGKVGNTGRVEGPHLHFEILVGDVQVDPLAWLGGEFP